MADYKSTHTGAEIDAGIDKAVTADTNWKTLMANLGIGRWANQNFENLVWLSSPNIYDSLLPYYTNYTRCFARVTYEGLSSNTSTMEVQNDMHSGNTGIDANLSFMFYMFNASATRGGVLVLRNYKDTIKNWGQVYGLHTFSSTGLYGIRVKEGCTFNVPARCFYFFAYNPKLTEISGDFDFRYVGEWHPTCFDGTNNLKTFKVKNFNASLNITKWANTMNEEEDLTNVISSLYDFSGTTSTRTLTVSSTQDAVISETARASAIAKNWVIAVA